MIIDLLACVAYFVFVTMAPWPVGAGTAGAVLRLSSASTSAPSETACRSTELARHGCSAAVLQCWISAGNLTNASGRPGIRFDDPPAE